MENTIRIIQVLILASLFALGMQGKSICLTLQSIDSHITAIHTQLGTLILHNTPIPDGFGGAVIPEAPL